MAGLATGRSRAIKGSSTRDLGTPNRAQRLAILRPRAGVRQTSHVTTPGGWRVASRPRYIVSRYCRLHLAMRARFAHSPESCRQPGPTQRVHDRPGHLAPRQNGQAVPLRLPRLDPHPRSQPTPALTDGPDELWRTIVGVHLTTRRRLVTVIELGRKPSDVVRPLVLAAEIHAGWPGAKFWLGTGAQVLPRLEYVPDLREALDRTLAEAVERVEQWILEAGWERDYS